MSCGDDYKYHLIREPINKKAYCGALAGFYNKEYFIDDQSKVTCGHCLKHFSTPRKEPMLKSLADSENYNKPKVSKADYGALPPRPKGPII